MSLTLVPFHMYHTSACMRLYFFSFCFFLRWVERQNAIMCFVSFRLEERRQCTKTGD